MAIADDYPAIAARLRDLAAPGAPDRSSKATASGLEAGSVASVSLEFAEPDARALRDLRYGKPFTIRIAQTPGSGQLRHHHITIDVTGPAGQPKEKCPE